MVMSLKEVIFGKSSVDEIIAQFTGTIDQLHTHAESENRRYSDLRSKVYELIKESDNALLESERALDVATKIRKLVG